MSVTFTKLFSSITESTVWCEPDRTRIVWITMLAMADKRGRIWASIPGLAGRARVPIEDCQIALDTFLGPDRYSRTEENDGKRKEKIDGGWQLLNYTKYREMRDEETVREIKRRYMRDKRARDKGKITIKAQHVTVEQTGNSGTQWNQAEADAEAVIPSTSAKK